MSKLWSKHSSIVKNLYKKYKVDICKKKVYTLRKKDLDVEECIYKTDPELIYKIIENPDTNIKNIIYEFINKYYINIYSNELLDYLLKNSVCIIFFHENDEHSQLQDAIIGLAFFHKDYFYSKENLETPNQTPNQTPYVNVKLLCLRSNFHNVYNIKFIIKCIDEITNEMSDEMSNEMSNEINPNVKYIIYKLRRPIPLPYFCKKCYYCRPINIDHTIANKDRSFYFNMNNSNLQLIKKLYNTFSYPTYFVNDFYLDFFLDLNDLTYNEKISFVDTIFNLLNDYKSSTYTIYKNDTKQDIEEMLSNPNFYKFVIRDHNNVINNFVCLYYYDIQYETKCKNAIVYSIVLEDLSLSYLSYILEYISEYCYINNLCDMISLENFVDITGYKLYKLCRFHLDCYYYCEQFNKINPCKNGLTSF